MLYLGVAISVTNLQWSVQMKVDPLLFVCDDLSFACSNNGSNTTSIISDNITVIGIHDGLHQPPRFHLKEEILFMFTFLEQLIFV